jgi:hypothetical protein
MKTCIDNQKPKTEAKNSAPGENTLEFNMDYSAREDKNRSPEQCQFCFCSPCTQKSSFLDLQ